jgi:hypothetical protein
MNRRCIEAAALACAAPFIVYAGWLEWMKRYHFADAGKMVDRAEVLFFCPPHKKPVNSAGKKIRGES